MRANKDCIVTAKSCHPSVKKNLLQQDTGEPGWWRGEIGGKEGVFPDNFVVMHTEAEVRSSNK